MEKHITIGSATVHTSLNYIGSLPAENKCLFSARTTPGGSVELRTATLTRKRSAASSF